jgi:hypothetical protein
MGWEVIPWEEAEDVWGIAYRDSKKGTLYSERIGTRQEADARADEVRKEGEEKGRPQPPGESDQVLPGPPHDKEITR